MKQKGNYINFKREKGMYFIKGQFYIWFIQQKRKKNCVTRLQEDSKRKLEEKINENYQQFKWANLRA